MWILVLVALVATSAFAREIPWADRYIHTNPVLERGLGPEMVTPGYELTTLTAIGRDGEEVTRYESWMSGRGGERVTVAFRPGEAVEARKTGVRTVILRGCTYEVETWFAKRLVRCGNPTEITFYRWFEIKTVTRTVTVTTPGRDGCDGQDGADGRDGRDGVDGRDGKDGVDGRDGCDGAPGPRGPRGFRGEKGEPGDTTVIDRQPIVVNNISNNFTTSNYSSMQMMGQYGATTNSWALMGVGVSFTEPTQININNSNVNNNSNSNTNVNANTNVVNVGDGSATGTTNADGNSAATSGR